MKKLTLTQDSISLSLQIKRLTAERKALNKERKILNQVIRDMQSLPLTTYLDKFTTEELDEQLRKGL